MQPRLIILFSQNGVSFKRPLCCSDQNDRACILHATPRSSSQRHFVSPESLLAAQISIFPWSSIQGKSWETHYFALHRKKNTHTNQEQAEKYSKHFTPLQKRYLILSTRECQCSKSHQPHLTVLVCPPAASITAPRSSSCYPKTQSSPILHCRFCTIHKNRAAVARICVLIVYQPNSQQPTTPQDAALPATTRNHCTEQKAAAPPAQNMGPKRAACLHVKCLGAH